MILSIYRIKLRTIVNPITVMGIGYEVEKGTGIMRIYDRHRHGGEWQNVEIFTAAHGEWHWIRKIGERDE